MHIFKNFKGALKNVLKTRMLNLGARENDPVNGRNSVLGKRKWVAVLQIGFATRESH